MRYKLQIWFIKWEFICLGVQISFFFLLSSASWLLLCLPMFIFLDLLMIIFHSFCSFPFLFSLFLHYKVLFTSCWSLLQLHLVFKLGFYRWGTCFSCIYIYCSIDLYFVHLMWDRSIIQNMCNLYTLFIHHSRGCTLQGPYGFNVF